MKGVNITHEGSFVVPSISLMPIIHLETTIDAPVERVFDLARSIEMHTESMNPHDERAVGGVTGGLLSTGDRVTWRARHFGVPLSMTVALTECDHPSHFRDEMVDGPFERLRHDHYFAELHAGRSKMHDRFSFSSPFGPLGRAVDTLYLRRYMKRLLRSRNRELKRVAESDAWRQYLDDG